MGQETFLTISSTGVYDARAMGVKVTVVGGGSTYTPELVEGFVTRGDRLPVDDLVLLDVDPERLAIVGALADRMLRRVGWAGNLTLTGDRDEALEGADFVIVQLRVGGQAARVKRKARSWASAGRPPAPVGSPNLAHPLGVGAGGRNRSPRNGAWFVDFTNPTGLVTQALLDEGHRALGLCNVAIGFQRRFAAHFDVGPEQVQLEHVGLNHLTWERKVLVDGVDRLPEILDSAIEPVADENNMPPSRSETSVRSSYYLHYYYPTERVLEQQRTGRHARKR
jgi:6-phospho-beta-glucosidase